MLTTHELDDSRPAEPKLPFADHHAKLEAACEALRACTYADDPSDLIARYRAFERAVLDHLEDEEQTMLPAYAEYEPGDAAGIRATHAELRRQLYRLGVDVELHSIRARALEKLVQTLRAHAAHEDRGMYAWAQAHLPPKTRRELVARMAASLRLLAHDARMPRPQPSAPAVPNE